MARHHSPIWVTMAIAGALAIALPAAASAQPTSSFTVMAENLMVAGEDIDIAMTTYSPSTADGGITAPLAVVPPADTPGCEVGDYSDVSGQIALIERGACTLAQKQQSAAEAGAVGAVIYNNAGAAFEGTLGDPSAGVIPTGGISQEDGESLTAEDGASATLELVATYQEQDADLAVDKECEPGTVAPGDTVECAVTVINQGPADATGVELTDTLGEGLTLTGPPAGGGFDCDQAIRCTRDQLPAGQHATISYTVTVAADLGPEVVVSNTAEVASASPEDPARDNNTATATVATPDCTIDARDASWAQAITGTDGDDVICGSQHADAINAGGGDDLVFGFGGSDGLRGGAGHDRLYGSDGHDGVTGDAGDDTLYGGPGYDGLTGGAGNDTLDGGPSYDGCNPGPGTNQPTTSCP